MEKYCVFCGNKPQEKNKEHIIPRWLISATGDLKRNINLGMDMKPENGGHRIRSYAFDQLTLPACEKCNEEFGKVEGKVKGVMESILEHDCMQYADVSILLDWFDKVRIGLWHYYYIMNGNVMNIDPHFHINNRVRTFDRMLIVYKVPSGSKGINFIGTDTMAFQLMPSAFLFRVNNYYFINVSKEFLLAQRFGFPLVKYRFLEGGTEMYQPILYDMQGGYLDKNGVFQCHLLQISL